MLYQSDDTAHAEECDAKVSWRSGERCSEVIPELQIVDGRLSNAQQLMSERINKCKDSNPAVDERASLFSRNIFCDHCDGRLVLTTNGKRKVTDETGAVTVVPKLRYVCYKKTRHHNCDGQTGYTVSKLDGLVEQVVLRLFERLQDKPPEELISADIQRKQETTRAVLASAEKNLAKHKKEYNTYKAEVIKALQGKSKLQVQC